MTQFKNMVQNEYTISHFLFFFKVTNVNEDKY